MNSAFCLSRLFQSSSVKNGCCFTSKALPVEMKEKTEKTETVVVEEDGGET